MRIEPPIPAEVLAAVRRPFEGLEATLLRPAKLLFPGRTAQARDSSVRRSKRCYHMYQID